MKSEQWNKTLYRLKQKVGKFKYPLAILLLGILLLAVPVDQEVSEPEVTNAQESQLQVTDELQQMEEELDMILSQIDGAGKVEVMLRYATSSRTVYQTDSSQEVHTESESKQTKTDIQTVIASQSSGVDAPVVVQTICPKFQGALVVAQGAGSAEVRLNLVNAVSSLTGLGADKITVIKMKSK